VPVLRELVDFIVEQIESIDRFERVGRGIKDPFGFKPIPAAFVAAARKSDSGGSDGDKKHSTICIIQVIGTTEKGSGARIEDLIALVENKLDSDVSLGDKGKYSFGDDREWELGYDVSSGEATGAFAECSFTFHFETDREAN